MESSNMIINADMKEEFLELFTEFLDKYASTNEGKKHLNLYSRGRQEAQINYQKILDMEKRGEDVSDEILLKLFPHANTSSNREKGNRWIHIAPAITRDAKEWFEGAKWAKPEDWPAKTSLILEFYKNVLGGVALQDECKRFYESPLSMGLQTGMMTPFLNAIQPEKYAIINNKSRKVINKFKSQGPRLRQALIDYPAANEIAMGLTAILKDKIDKSGLDFEYRSDVFDMFCHWLVAIKKYFRKGVVDGSGIRYWKIAPGENACKWDECREGGYIAIGWGLVGDLTEFENKGDLRTKFEEIRKEHKSWKLGGINQLWIFSKIIKTGDRIIANRGLSEVVGIGTVSGEYEFFEDSDYPHRIPVEWEDIRTREHDLKGWRNTIIEMNEEKYNTIRNLPPIQPEIIDDDILKEIEESIKRKGQVILYGPPGTGKTYTARRFAVYWLLKNQGKKGINEILADSERLIEEERKLSSASVSRRTWWLVANPKTWKWETLFEKDKEIFTYGRIQRNYSLVQRGDLIIGYEATPAKQIKALARISDEFGTHEGLERTIEIEPVSLIKNGLTFEELSKDPVLMESEPIRFNNQGTLFALTSEQSEYALSLLSERDPNIQQYINSDQNLNILTRLTFHPSYTYEDFIEGFKPVETGTSGMHLHLEDGSFKKICREAQTEPDKKFLVLIDEINRANIAKVFGELVTLLEVDKRNLAVTLPQSKESFLIPPNVYILGTMNTADRSIKLLDVALRRRFAFVEIMPDTSLLRNSKVESLPLDKFLEELNYRIAKHIGREKQIGHSFFLSDEGLPITDPDDFACCFRQEILPLLQEYCYEDYTTLALFIGDNLVDKETQTLNKDILSDPQKLIGALTEELIRENGDVE